MSSSPKSKNPLDDLKIYEVVGRGTFGLVHRAKNKRTGEDVAVKTFGFQTERESFQNEIETLKRVNHPHIIKLYAWSPDGSNIVMEYADGGNLYDLLHKHTDLEYGIDHALTWCYQSASALAYLHQQTPTPIVHRDFKPPNILLQDFCRKVKVCDFGIACDVTSHMTNNRGTTYWMAPEVFVQVPNRYTEACDIFSYGITFWEIMARKKPFSGKSFPTTYAVMWAIADNKRPVLLENCPPLLEKLMTKCWAHDPKERPRMEKVEALLKKLTGMVVNHELAPINVPQKRTESSEIAQVKKMINEKRESIDGSRIYDFLPPMQDFPLTPVTHQHLPRTSRDEIEFLNVPPLVGYQRGHVRTGSFHSPEADNLEQIQRTRSMDGHLDNINDIHRPRASPSTDDGYRTGTLSASTIFAQALDPSMRPIPPDPSSEESLRLYDEHSTLCHKFVKLQHELNLLQQRESELSVLEASSYPPQNIDYELDEQNREMRELFAFRTNLVEQVKKIRQRNDRREANEAGFVYVEEDRLRTFSQV